MSSPDRAVSPPAACAPACVILPPHRFPRGVVELAPVPELLVLWGELPAPPWVAIVGTRKPSEQGRAFARTLAGDLASRGVVVASGGALGIDGAAHEGALDVGGATVVVAPTRLEKPYPKRNAELFARVLEQGGAYLTQEQCEQTAKRHHFFARNALLVACSEVVVVVEAPLRSGARNAALWARRLGRPLYAVPHAPWSPKGQGCIQELQRGARVLSSYKQVLSALSERHWPELWSESAVERSRFDGDGDAQFAAERDEQMGLPFPREPRSVRR